jgi:hypothetical protein
MSTNLLLAGNKLVVFGVTFNIGAFLSICPVTLLAVSSFPVTSSLLGDKGTGYLSQPSLPNLFWGYLIKYDFSVVLNSPHTLDPTTFKGILK